MLVLLYLPRNFCVCHQSGLTTGYRFPKWRGNASEVRVAAHEIRLLLSLFLLGFSPGRHDRYATSSLSKCAKTSTGLPMLLYELRIIIDAAVEQPCRSIIDVGGFVEWSLPSTCGWNSPLASLRAQYKKVKIIKIKKIPIQIKVRTRPSKIIRA